MLRPMINQTTDAHPGHTSVYTRTIRRGVVRSRGFTNRVFDRFSIVDVDAIVAQPQPKQVDR